MSSIGIPELDSSETKLCRSSLGVQTSGPSQPRRRRAGRLYGRLRGQAGPGGWREHEIELFELASAFGTLLLDQIAMLCASPLEGGLSCLQLTHQLSLLKQVVENLGNSQYQRDVSLAFEDLKLCAGDVLTEPYRMLGPDVAIVRAVPPTDQPPIVTNSPRPRWLRMASASAAASAIIALLPDSSLVVERPHPGLE